VQVKNYSKKRNRQVRIRWSKARNSPIGVGQASQAILPRNERPWRDWPSASRTRGRASVSHYRCMKFEVLRRQSSSERIRLHSCRETPLKVLRIVFVNRDTTDDERVAAAVRARLVGK
jgi:hypothetical protein